MTKIYSHILIMKAGPYCNYSLDEIIDIKQKEQQKIGKFFWGYGGVFCRPNIINAFISHALANKKRPVVLFSTTISAYNTSDGGRFTHFSSDKSIWQSLPSEVLLVGNKNAPHFAIVARNLKKVNIQLNLSNYCSFTGVFPNPDKYLDHYFRFRVDKACGYYLPRNTDNPKIIKIDYISELVEPYCIFIK